MAAHAEPIEFKGFDGKLFCPEDFDQKEEVEFFNIARIIRQNGEFVARLKDEIAQADRLARELDVRDEMLSERDDMIDELRQQLEPLQEAKASHESQLAERDTTIHELRQQLEPLQKTLTSLKSQLAELEQKLEPLQEAQTSLESQLAERDGMITRLEQQLASVLDESSRMQQAEFDRITAERATKVEETAAQIAQDEEMARVMQQDEDTKGAQQMGKVTAEARTDLSQDPRYLEYLRRRSKK